MYGTPRGKVEKKKGPETGALFYSLLSVENKTLITASALDRPAALAIFGEKLGLALTLEGGKATAPYLLDEWVKNPHWGAPHIPVYVKQNP